jgi:hypothetical protein
MQLLTYGVAANISDKCTALANNIEQEIFSQHGQEINNEYKEAVRSHVFNLKDSKNNLRSRLLNDELQPTAFAEMVGIIKYISGIYFGL